MATIEVTKTELVWPGKHNEDGTRKEVPRVNLPFQIIERVNESRATREAQKQPIQPGLFDVWEGKEGDTFEEGWRNKLIWGDNLLVMGSLLEKFAGRIDLIYIDPPFATGSDFSFNAEIGEDDDEVTKKQSLIEEKAYRDTWGGGLESYFQVIYERLLLARELLADTGSIYVHCDSRVNSGIRYMLDEIFGTECYRNEIVWFYPHMSNVRADFARKHDTILRYAKSKSWVFNLDEVRLPYDEKTLRRYEKDVVFPGGYQAKANPLGKIPEDVWQIPLVRNVSRENVRFQTQKPERLLDRVIRASSNRGDLVADFFCGSGTTLAVAEKLGRRWIGCDLGRYAIHVTRKRLLDIEGCKSFELLNLGKYERQYWQGVTFGEGQDKTFTEQALYEYLAFILRLYGAQPVPGLIHLHGRKGRALVHIGSVDAPVTIDEINAALRECLQLKQSELHILGWEWEMGLNDLVIAAARRRGARLSLLQIPREVMEQQAVEQGDIQFFELAYLDVDVTTAQGLTAQVTLKDFVIPNTELIPEEVRTKIKKWSDYIDYWAIDWSFQNDTFMQGWVTYRTRQDRRLTLTSDTHTYEQPGTYQIVVKVVDIFGNDTSHAYLVEVR